MTLLPALSLDPLYSPLTLAAGVFLLVGVSVLVGARWNAFMSFVPETQMVPADIVRCCRLLRCAAAAVSGLRMVTVCGLRVVTVSGLRVVTVSGLRLATVCGLRVVTVSGLRVLTVSGLRATVGS